MLWDVVGCCGMLGDVLGCWGMLGDVGVCWGMFMSVAPWGCLNGLLVLAQASTRAAAVDERLQLRFAELIRQVSNVNAARLDDKTALLSQVRGLGGASECMRTAGIV